jgi:uncharacterized membrane protein YdbT with pleckstrin-like domain
MASYVESVLAGGEKIIHRASISHWNFALSYFIGAALIAGGLAALFMSNRKDVYFGAAVALAVGLAALISAAIRRATTELVLTDRRIITKRGLISRDTVEMNLAKVESVHVNQSLLGRMLNYGDVTVVGTGSSLEPLVGIARPLELRRKLGEVSQLRDSKSP